MEVYSGEYVGKTMPWTHDWEWFQHTTYGDDWGAISIWRFHKVMWVPEKNHPAIGIFRIFHERVTIQRCFWGPPWLWKPDEISWNVWEIGRNKNWGFMVTSGIDVEPNFLRQLAIEASTAGCLLNKTLWSYWYATKKNMANETGQVTLETLVQRPSSDVPLHQLLLPVARHGSPSMPETVQCFDISSLPSKKEPVHEG